MYCICCLLFGYPASVNNPYSEVWCWIENGPRRNTCRTPRKEPQPYRAIFNFAWDPRHLLFRLDAFSCYLCSQACIQVRCAVWIHNVCNIGSMRKNHKLTRLFSIGDFAVIGLLAITACVTGAQPTNASPPCTWLPDCVCSWPRNSYDRTADTSRARVCPNFQVSFTCPQWSVSLSFYELSFSTLYPDPCTSHDISSCDGLDECFTNLKRDTIALPAMEGLCVRK